MGLTPRYSRTPFARAGWRRWAGRWWPRLAAVGLLAAAVVLLIAAAGSAAPASGRVMALAGSVDAVLGNIRNWLMGILAALATTFLTIGGVRYVTAAGNPGEVEKAKTAFKSAAIGYALAALAPLVVTVLQGIVGN